uniref:Uncharacterized protein n=1 Tax=Oryza meridionalis TaxID=40149 RepID=A0A0E0DP73_9ORYZ
MAEDSGAILRHISSLKDMLDKDSRESATSCNRIWRCAVQRCPNTTTAIMKEMRAYLKKNSRIGKYLNLHPSSYRPMPSSETAAKRKQAPAALQFGRPTPKQTTSVASMLCKAPEEVDEDIHAKGPSQSTIEQCTRRYNGKQMGQLHQCPHFESQLLFCPHFLNMKQPSTPTCGSRLVNEEIEENIQKTREIESEIVKHSETEKEYIMKESELMKGVSIAEFELNGIIQVADSRIANIYSLLLLLPKRAEQEIMPQIVYIIFIREKFINESKGFQANKLGDLNKDLVLLLKEKGSLGDESENLKMKINAIESSSRDYIADILEELNMENSVLESELQYKISEYMDVMKDISNLKALFSSINS